MKATKASLLERREGQAIIGQICKRIVEVGRIKQGEGVDVGVQVSSQTWIRRERPKIRRASKGQATQRERILGGAEAPEAGTLWVTGPREASRFTTAFALGIAGAMGSDAGSASSGE